MVPGIWGGLDGFVLIFIDVISRFIELFAISLIFGSVVVGSYRYFLHKYSEKMGKMDRTIRYRHFLGQWLLLGLELLVAADVIRTVALDLNLEGVVSLGLLVLIRTFLSWALIVEMEGRWPWQPVNSKEIGVIIEPE